MEEIIIKLINEYNENNNLEALLQKIYKIAKQELGIKDYTKQLKILKERKDNEKTRGCLDKDGNVIIYKKGIKLDIDEILEELPYLNEDEKNMLIVVEYIKTLLHELEHVRQNKLKKENNNDIETTILKLSNTNKNDLSKIAYKCLYETHPQERLAEYQAKKTVIKILEDLGYDNIALKLKSEYIYEKFIHYYNYGLIGPTNNHFKLFLKEKEKEQFNKSKKESNLNLEDRLKYGLEITEEEYVSTVMEYKEVTDELKERKNKRTK